MKRMLLGAFALALLAGIAAPAYAANYCDSQGGCTGPSANDMYAAQRWGYMPSYQYQGMYIPYQYAGYTPYTYGNSYPGYYPTQSTYPTYRPYYPPLYQQPQLQQPYGYSYQYQYQYRYGY